MTVIEPGLDRMTRATAFEPAEVPPTGAGLAPGHNLTTYIAPVRGTALPGAVAFVRQLGTFEGYRDNTGRRIWEIYKPQSYYPQAWCGGTQGAVAKLLGMSNAPTTHARVINCEWIRADARKAGRLVAPTAGAARFGWKVLHDWSGEEPADGTADHVTTLLEDDPRHNYVTVIGGNHGDAAPDAKKRQRGVFIRNFPRSSVCGYVNCDDMYAPFTLMLGMRCETVKYVQNGLLTQFPSYAGPIRTSGGADGVYGKGTASVVEEFQRRVGLPADGIVGARTWAALKRFNVLP